MNMKKPSYTKGPWTIHSCGADTNEIVGDGQVVAVAWRADTDPANAKLIAASPAIAEALAQMVDRGHQDDCDTLRYAGKECSCPYAISVAALQSAGFEF